MEALRGGVPQIDAVTAAEKMKSGEALLVDVREQEEWDRGHIEGIAFIPMGQLPWRWRELDPDRRWIVVCRSGNRSYYAAAMLRQAGIDAANLSGGMLEWQASKLPITPPGIVDQH